MSHGRLAILALLAERPRHGYALRAAIEERLGDGAAGAGRRVYQTLASLARDGLVSCSPSPAGRRPPRRVYAPTARGREALEAWLRRDRRGRGPSLADVLLRLALAPGASAPFLAPLLADAIARARSERESLEWRADRASRPEGWPGLVRALEAEAALGRARLELDLLERVRDVVRRAREGARAAEALRATKLCASASPREPGG